MGKEEVLLCMGCERAVYQKVPRPFVTPEYHLPPADLNGFIFTAEGNPAGPPPPSWACPSNLPTSRFKVCVSKVQSKGRFMSYDHCSFPILTDGANPLCRLC